MEKYEDRLIAEYVTKSTKIAIKNAFAIGKFACEFVEFNATAEAGNRLVGVPVVVYVDVADMLAFCSDVRMNFILRDLQKAKEAGKYEPVFAPSPGGISAEQLKKRGQARPDGKSLSRFMSVSYGNKQDVAIVAKQGPGEQDAKGLIVPKFGKNPEMQIFVAMPYRELKKLCVMMEKEYEGYCAAVEVMKAFDKRSAEKKAAADNKNPTTRSYF